MMARAPFRPPLDWPALVAPSSPPAPCQGWRRGSARATGARRGWPGAPPEVEVRLAADGSALEVEIDPASPPALEEAVGRVRWMLEAAAPRRAERWRPWRAYAAQHLWMLDADAAR